MQHDPRDPHASIPPGGVEQPPAWGMPTERVPGRGEAPEDPGGPTGRVPGSLIGAAIAAVVITALVLISAVAAALPGPEPEPGAVIPDDPVGASLHRFQSRYMIGAASDPDFGSGGAMFADQLETQFPAGPPRIRLRTAIALAELAGPQKGLEILDRLDGALAAAPDRTISEADAELASVLRGHFSALAEANASGLTPPAMDDDDRTRLEAELGWFGAIAAGLGPVPGTNSDAKAIGDAVRTFQGVIIAFGGVAVAGLIGFCLLVAAIVLLFTQGRGAPGPDDSAWGLILVETFAVWFVLFIGAQTVIGLVGSGLSVAGGLFAAAGAFFFSLLSVAWPVVRGAEGREVLRVLGVHRGKGVFVEIGCGILAWMAALPMLGVGVLITLLLIALGLGSGIGGSPDDAGLGPVGGPAHPIVGAFGGPNPGLTAMAVLLVGAVAAPIVEEIAFRGMLYTPFRQWLGRAGRIVATAVAAVLTAFIFAVIHPQGIVAVPALGSLAIAFAIAREWRGSLIAPIVMHAINNGLVLGGMVLLMG